MVDTNIHSWFENDSLFRKIRNAKLFLNKRRLLKVVPSIDLQRLRGKLYPFIFDDSFIDVFIFYFIADLLLKAAILFEISCKIHTSATR